MSTPQQPDLTPHELERYAWQLDVPGHGPAQQAALKNATVLISRVGGLGGVVAFQLAAAGVGHLILAHGGDLKPSDLNRQILMAHDDLATPRVLSAARTLQRFNPSIRITPIPHNISPGNADGLVQQADVVVDAAPLFEERFALNDAACRHRRPMVECAMFELNAQITVLQPPQTPCLRCLYPETPAHWKRRFPVFGAVSGTVGCIAAMETIKLITRIAEPLLSRLLLIDLRSTRFQTIRIKPRPDCPLCASLTAPASHSPGSH